MSGRNTSDIESADQSHAVWAAFNDVSPEYFEALGIPIVAGRVFRREEAGVGDLPVVVSERAARELWPGKNPIGQRIRTGNVDGRPPKYSVVTGVAKDVHSHSIGEPDQPFIYQPVDQTTPAGRRLIVTTAPASSAAVLTMAAALVREEAPWALVDVARFEDRIEQTLAPARLAARFATALGVLATVLAVVGIYGIVSYGVTQRSREFGVRIALGASPPEIARLALGQGFSVVAGGLVVGVGLAVAAAQLIRGMLYGLGALDPLSLGAMVVVVAATAGVAMLVPARRATAINPIESLRAD